MAASLMIVLPRMKMSNVNILPVCKYRLRVVEDFLFQKYKMGDAGRNLVQQYILSVFQCQTKFFNMYSRPDDIITK